MTQFLDFVRSLEPPTVAISARAADDAFRLALSWQRSGIQAVWLSGSHMTTREGYLREHAAALQFPPYFGHNLDALDECLTDLGWLPEGPIALFVLDAVRVLVESTRPTIAVAIATWTDAADFWIGRGRPFHVVLQVERAEQRLPADVAGLPRLRYGRDPGRQEFAEMKRLLGQSRRVTDSPSDD